MTRQNGQIRSRFSKVLSTSNYMLDRLKISRPFLVAVALLAGSVALGADSVASFTLPSGVAIRIVEAPFVRAKNKIRGCTGLSTTCLINGRTPFGNDNDLPTSYVKSITASFQGKTYLLEASQMFNAWGDRPLQVPTQRYFGGSCRDTENCVFRGLFSDGGAAFVAEWRVIFGVPVRTVLTWSTDVIGLFMRDIDAAEAE